ncbi:MAG TPA: TIGR00730 family Rossman fold protein [Gemmatimonadaceae bacterium]|nr:TIGR00730 family Rossman fold protein [Gemmatimonadaceae bacterium]
MPLSRLCVFCGSSAGARPEYAAAARRLGRLLAERGIGLVYGGGGTGIMGELADAALAAGADVVGVIPHALRAREAAHRGLSDLRLVDTMHERKSLMAELADGFVALPGGLGTLEELFEIWTWAQLGVHAKPCALLDVEGYYAPLLAFLDRAVEERFVRAPARAMLLVDPDPAALLDRLAAYEPPAVTRWMGRGET